MEFTLDQLSPVAVTTTVWSDGLPAQLLEKLLTAHMQKFHALVMQAD